MSERDELPRTFRPRRARHVINAISAFLLAVMAVITILLPTSGWRPWSLTDRLAVFAVGLAMVAFLQRHSRVRAVARTDGLHVVNMFRARTVAWSTITAVRLSPGDPWVYLDVGEERNLPVMGIQGSDGAAARADALELARLVERLGRE